MDAVKHALACAIGIGERGLNAFVAEDTGHFAEDQRSILLRFELGEAGGEVVDARDAEGVSLGGSFARRSRSSDLGAFSARARSSSRLRSDASSTWARYGPR